MEAPMNRLCGPNCSHNTTSIYFRSGRIRRILLVTLAVALCATGASANRYEDCHQTKDADRQIRGCTRIIERGKKEPRKNRSIAHFSRGVAYFGKGETDRAISDFNEAIALNPKYTSVYWARGHAYDTKGDRDQAIADFTKAIALNPKDDFIYSVRAEVYFKGGELDRAIGDITKAIEIKPSARYYFNRGVAYIRKGDKEHATADLRSALAINSSFPRAKETLKALEAIPAAAKAGTPPKAKGMSDKALQLLMDNAWQYMPVSCKFKDGTALTIDKNARSQYTVDTKLGKEIVRIARIGAHAKICGLSRELLRKNSCSFWSGDLAPASASYEQKVYLFVLRAFIEGVLLGQIQMVKKGEDAKPH